MANIIFIATPYGFDANEIEKKLRTTKNIVVINVPTIVKKCGNKMVKDGVLKFVEAKHKNFLWDTRSEETNEIISRLIGKNNKSGKTVVLIDYDFDNINNPRIVGKFICKLTDKFISEHSASATLVKNAKSTIIKKFGNMPQWKIDFALSNIVDIPEMTSAEIKKFEKKIWNRMRKQHFVRADVADIIASVKKLM